MASKSILVAPGGRWLATVAKSQVSWRGCATTSKPSAASALRRFQLSLPSRLPRAAASFTADTRGLTKGSQTTSLLSKSWETTANGQTLPGHSGTWRKRLPCGGERRSQVSSSFHFSLTQRVLTATGQNGGAQPPPRACLRDAVRARDRERQAEPWRELTSLSCDSKLTLWESRAVLSGSGTELQGILKRWVAASRVCKL